MQGIKELKKIAKKVRQDIVRLNSRCGSGHYASSLSCVEILLSIYLGGILNYKSDDMLNRDRDRFIMSKGQGATALYSVLYHSGVFKKEVLDLYCTSESKLGGLLSEYLPYGIEFSTGSLGHGLGFAGGVALNGKLEEKEYHTYVLMGDGECQEGTIWEAALCIPHYKLGNLTAIIDYNGLQASERVNKIISLMDLKRKWEAFGWNVLEVDGHDIKALICALQISKKSSDIPSMIIAQTVKGKGISFMENSVDWHCRIMDDEQLKIAKEDLLIGE